MEARSGETTTCGRQIKKKKENRYRRERKRYRVTSPKGKGKKGFIQVKPKKEDNTIEPRERKNKVIARGL